MKSDDLPLPRRTAAASGLAVRPDVLVALFAARVAEVDPDRAILVLRAASDVLTRRMREVHPAAVLRMTGLDFGRDASKSSRDELHTRVEGTLELPLAPELDWWARAQLAAQVTVLARILAGEARKQKPVIDIAFQQPVALVREPERHRGEVLRRWVTRCNELAAAAQSERFPLQVTACEPPGEVTQTAVSVEEVRLSITLDGRIEALPSRP
jgi:hypothetical protein